MRKCIENEHGEIIPAPPIAPAQWSTEPPKEQSDEINEDECSPECQTVAALETALAAARAENEKLKDTIARPGGTL